MSTASYATVTPVLTTRHYMSLYICICMCAVRDDQCQRHAVRSVLRVNRSDFWPAPGDRSTHQSLCGHLTLLYTSHIWMYASLGMFAINCIVNKGNEATFCYTYTMLAETYIHENWHWSERIKEKLQDKGLQV